MQTKCVARMQRYDIMLLKDWQNAMDEMTKQAEASCDRLTEQFKQFNRDQEHEARRSRADLDPFTYKDQWVQHRYLFLIVNDSFSSPSSDSLI